MIPWLSLQTELRRSLAHRLPGLTNRLTGGVDKMLVQWCLPASSVFPVARPTVPVKSLRFKHDMTGYGIRALPVAW